LRPGTTARLPAFANEMPTARPVRVTAALSDTAGEEMVLPLTRVSFDKQNPW
jgi:hypothetical protein